MPTIVRILDRYEFNPSTDKLGEGGFSTVYKAQDTHRNRIVVLKVYDKQHIGKFDIIHEIQKVESIMHPNLVRYYDAFYWKAQDWYGNEQNLQVGVMEYVNKGSLKTFLEKEPLNEAIFEKIILDVMEGLKALHAHSIVHLDLKPENIFIEEREGSITAKIGDFGISRVLEQSAESSTLSTVVGTPEYMAPEVLFRKKYGRDGKIVFNADIWSLGILVWMFFKGEGGSRKSSTEAMEERIERIETWKSDVEGIPDKWRRLLELCLEPQAGKRVGSIEELQIMWQAGGLAQEGDKTLVYSRADINIRKMEGEKESKPENTRITKGEIKIRQSTLMEAAGSGHKEVVELLLQRGAEGNAKNKNGLTALMEAAKNGHKEVVELLLQRGAEGNAKNKNGETALMVAAFNGHKEVVELLLQRGAEVNAKNNIGRTAYDWALRDEIRQILRAYGGKSGEEL